MDYFLTIFRISVLRTSTKYVHSKGEKGAKQKPTSIVFMTSFYCLEAYKGEGLSENHQIWAAYFMDGPFLKFIYGHVAMPSIEI